MFPSGVGELVETEQKSTDAGLAGDETPGKRYVAPSLLEV